LELDGHRDWRLAAARVGSENEEALADVVGKKRWDLASRIVDWRPDADVIEYHVLDCPVKSRVSLFKAVFTHALYAHDELVSVHEVESADRQKLVALADDKWIDL